MRGFIAAVCLAAFASAQWSVAQQAPSPPAPRTADGKPDLSGVWSNAGGEAEIERPDGVPLVLSREAYKASQAPGAKRIGVQRVDGEYRTALVIDPPDGKLPLRDRAKAMVWRQKYATFMLGVPVPEFTQGPDTLPNRDRCLMAANAASPPMSSQGYNDAYQIVQTPTSVLMSVEMMTDTRIIPVVANAAAAGAAHRPRALTRWVGDSVGWWEGDTFVVETLNIDPRQGAESATPMSQDARVIERFTLVDAEELVYRVEVTDPALYTRPWTMESSFHLTDRLWEYACHEGNYDVAHILATARWQERIKAKGKVGKKPRN